MHLRSSTYSYTVFEMHRTQTHTHTHRMSCVCVGIIQMAWEILVEKIWSALSHVVDRVHNSFFAMQCIDIARYNFQFRSDPETLAGDANYDWKPRCQIDMVQISPSFLLSCILLCVCVPCTHSLPLPTLLAIDWTIPKELAFGSTGFCVFVVCWSYRCRILRLLYNPEMYACQRHRTHNRQTLIIIRPPKRYRVGSLVSHGILTVNNAAFSCTTASNGRIVLCPNDSKL